MFSIGVLLSGLVLICHADPPSRSLPRVGIFYSGWHAEGFHAIDYVKSVGGVQYTMEDLIRGVDGINFHDIYEKHDVPSGFSWYWHTKPEAGFYCIYRKRPEEEVGHVPDCPDISLTLERHARELTEAGVDHVIVDATNLATQSAHADTINYRPFEVLVEEWKVLRGEGLVTPDVTIWFPIPPGANSYKWAMDNVYANPLYDDMILKDQNGRKVVHVVFNGETDDTIRAELEEVYGCTVVDNWALQNRDNYENGQWSMMQPCLGTNNGYSTTVVGRDCPITVTRNSPLGTMVPVARSYQLSHAALPWCSSGTHAGLTFKKQMDKALNERPDYLWITGWNELIAQPQSNPYDGNVDTPWMMGLENAVTHVSKFTGGHRLPLWVDLYGEEYSRDFEPNAYTGDALYKLMQSCVRVFRSGATTCNQGEEECCDLPSSDIYSNIFSFQKSDGDDWILTNSMAERDALIASGWIEECTRFPAGDSIWCVQGSKSDVTKGPFIMFKEGGPNRKAIYRCFKPGDERHFFSEYDTCEGHEMEYTLGYVSTVKNSETARSFRRCYHPTAGYHIHTLDNSCQDGMTSESMYGYVY